MVVKYHGIPYQVPVYVRPNRKHMYRFSHIRHTSLKKVFPSSLSVRELSQYSKKRDRNKNLYENAPIIILVTGHRVGRIISVALLNDALVDYDHSEKQEHEQNRNHVAPFSELNDDYIPVSYYNSVAFFERGRKSDWKLYSVVPVLSSWIVFPRTLCLSQINTLTKTFCNTAKKSLMTSLFVAENQKFSELFFSLKKIY